MAAGGIDVSRGSVLVDQGKKDNEHCRDASRESRSGHGGRHAGPYQKGCRMSSYQQVCGSGIRRKNVDHGLPNCASKKVEAYKDFEAQLPLHKKRKFSPVIWDIEDKLTRGLSRKKTEPAGVTTFPSKSVGEISNRMTDEDVRTSISLENLGGPAAATPSAEQNVCNDLEEGQVEEEQATRAPNIVTSRWALDLNSPKEPTLSDGEDISKASRWNMSSSTPESGEFLMDDSEGQSFCSSGSGRGGQTVGTVLSHKSSDNELESETLLDVDETRTYNSNVKEVEDEEPTTSSHGGMNMLHGSRSADEYEMLSKISEGTYGVVYRARDKKSGEIVALKKVKMNLGRADEYGFPLTSLREINILLSCSHPSIVNVKEVVVGNSDGVFMVMEHLEHDLKGIMDRMKQPFSTSEVKCLMIQILEGLKYLHHNWIIHRDLKPSNLLLNNKGELKICDFGMARQYGSSHKPYTQLVVTQWYRAPELLLGAKQYSTAIDMWSVGCIMAELFSKKPLFQGKGGSDIDQLCKIFGVLGTPNEMIWPGLSKLPGAKANFVKQPYNLLRKKFPAVSFTGSSVLSDLGFDLLNKLLTFDPEKRITVDAALSHDWFREVPLPKSKEFMPTFPPRRG